MLRYESNWGHDQPFAFLTGPPYLLIRCRPDPLQRPDAALITNPPIETSLFELLKDGFDRALHLPLIGVTTLDHALRQTVGREQYPVGQFGLCALNRVLKEIRHSSGKSFIGWITADFMLRNFGFSTGVLGPLRGGGPRGR